MNLKKGLRADIKNKKDLRVKLSTFTKLNKRLKKALLYIKGHYLTKINPSPLVVLHSLHLSAAKDETNTITGCPHHNAVKSEPVSTRAIQNGELQKGLIK